MELVNIIHFTKLPSNYHKIHFCLVDHIWYFSYQNKLYIYNFCFCLVNIIELTHSIKGLTYCSYCNKFLIYNDGYLYYYNKQMMLEQKISLSSYIHQYGCIHSIECEECNKIVCCFKKHILIIHLTQVDYYLEFPQELGVSICSTSCIQKERYILSYHRIYTKNTSYPSYHNYQIINSYGSNEYLYVLAYHDCHYILLQYLPCKNYQNHTIACIESNIARILDQEANKIQYALMNKCCIKDIICINHCVKETIDSVTKLELVLIKRLMTSTNNTQVD
ncbi:hypothetical protein [Tannockella kyphosi]|uniref:hypothetical protein n=1 Tax=Tannockella kyphosi TaxID=2899121 RepID=UPI002012D648|nr:hypothetical protein [Tannockella kyphosi]